MGWHCYPPWQPFSFTLTLPFSLTAALSPPPQAEKDKILKLSAEVLRLEKALQEERAQNQVCKTELAREKDSSLVRQQLPTPPHPETQRPPLLSVLGMDSEELSAELWGQGDSISVHTSQPCWWEMHQVPLHSQDVCLGDLVRVT